MTSIIPSYNGARAAESVGRKPERGRRFLVVFAPL